MAAGQSDCRCIEAETDAVDGFQVDLGICFEVLSQLCDKYVHTSAQEIVVFTPDIEQYLFPFEDAVGMLAKEFQQVRLFLGEVKDFLADGQLQIGIREVELADGESD